MQKVSILKNNYNFETSLLDTIKRLNNFTHCSEDKPKINANSNNNEWNVYKCKYLTPIEVYNYVNPSHRPKQALKIREIMKHVPAKQSSIHSLCSNNKENALSS